MTLATMARRLAVALAMSAFGRQAAVALDRAILQLDGAADSINDTSELDPPSPVRLDDAAVMPSDGRVEQIAAERA